jgi:ribosomal protein S18 acetylase RimI-like enzyme
LQIRDDDWLARILGYAVHRVEQADEGSVADTLGPHIAARASRAMYYTKVAVSDVATIRTLSALGFYVVDVNVTLGLDTACTSTTPILSPGVTIAECDETAAPGVLAIAGSAMRFSRFHLDPAIPVNVAHLIKREWIQNYVRRTRGEALMVARLNGEVAGFLAVLASDSGGRRVRVIDLIAVAPAAHRQGVGRALVTAFIAGYAPTSDRLQVGTQIANTPSLALYQGLGFTIRHASYVLHTHTPAAVSASA